MSDFCSQSLYQIFLESQILREKKINDNNRNMYKKKMN